MDMLTMMENNHVLRTCFPKIYKLMQLMCIIPTSAASVERGFSTMNLRNPFRSCLSQAKLTSLMMICSEGPQELTDQTLDELYTKIRDSKEQKITLSRSINNLGLLYWDRLEWPSTKSSHAGGLVGMMYINRFKIMHINTLKI